MSQIEQFEGALRNFAEMADSAHEMPYHSQDVNALWAFWKYCRAEALNEAALAAEAEMLEDPTDSADDMAYDNAVRYRVVISHIIRTIRALVAKESK
jgi:hypothetical protein